MAKKSQPDFPVPALLAWYREHGRSLPWRPTHPQDKIDPYWTLVSEQMCQQTQVATVIPYFHRFLEAFPTVDDLAAADEQAVLKLWQGLGYYRRARFLRAAAKVIVEEHGGQVPGDVKTLLRLPGVGRYTAGAVASIGFDVAAPIVDGNVMRVLARHDGIADAIDLGPTQKRLWTRAEQLVSEVPKGERGDFNQAMMELGATVCVPSGAKCLYCPLRKTCVAFSSGRVDALPVKTSKKKPTEVTHHVLAIEKNGKLLFEQRPSTGLWANMWQLPTVECLDSPPSGRGRGRGTTDPAASKQATPQDRTSPRRPLPPPLPEGGEFLRNHMRERLGLTVTPPEEVCRFQHATTHRAITFAVYTAQVETGRLKPKSGVWRRPEDHADLPLPKPQVKALQLLGHNP